MLRAADTVQPEQALHVAHVWIEVEDNGGTWEEHSHRDGRPHGLDIIRDLTTDNGRDGDPVTGWVMWMRFDWTASATDRQVPPRSTDDRPVR